MSDELDSKSDGELSKLFAVEVAGCVRRPADAKTEWYVPQGSVHGRGRWLKFLPDFCGDASAVLPWLEKESGVSAVYRGLSLCWCVTASGSAGTADEFARAAVLALIRAKRKVP